MTDKPNEPLAGCDKPKEATVSDVVVPEGMLKAAIESTCDTRLGMAEHTELVRQTLKAALRWLSENPIVPDHDQSIRLCEAYEARQEKPGYCESIRAVAVAWQQIMFAPPVDPRREKIIAILKTEWFPYEEQADKILAALKEE